MGRLFTYMVKAAAGQQPYTGLYGTWDGLYDMGGWEAVGQRLRYGELSSPSFRKFLRDRRRYIDEMYAASRSDNAQDWDNLQGADNYTTAIDSDFTDDAAIYDILSKNESYREAIRQLANTGDWASLRSIGGKVGRPRGMRSPFVGGRSDYLLANGVGNAQLIMNRYLVEEARRKAEEEAQRRQNAPQPQDPNIPEDTNVVAGTDGSQYLSSNTDRKEQTAANIGAALAAGQNPFAGARVRVHTLAAPGTTAPPPPATPVQAPQPQATTPRIGTFSEPAFVSSPMQVSFYNLPAGMTQEQAMQIWNTTGRSRMQRYLERTGRQGANNIQVSPDGSNLRLMHSNGGSTEMDTSLPIRLAGSNPKALRIYGSNPKAPRSTNRTSKTLLPPNLRERPSRPVNLRERPSRPVNLRERVTGTPRPQLGQVPQPHA